MIKTRYSSFFFKKHASNIKNEDVKVFWSKHKKHASYIIYVSTFLTKFNNVWYLLKF